MKCMICIYLNVNMATDIKDTLNLEVEDKLKMSMEKKPKKPRYAKHVHKTLLRK